MTLDVKLNDRYQHILWATIRHYVATAEPVGSKTLVNEYDFQVSSATVRNAMGRLEKAGLLYQPHTSAGRIPSDSGYRIYVDKLMTPDNVLGEHLIDLYQNKLNWGTYSLERLLQQATKVLAKVSGYIALITIPHNNNSHLCHLQLVPVNARQVMLIMVTDAYQTQSVLIELSEEQIDAEIDQEWLEEELKILSNFLNEKLRGQSLSTLNRLDWRELDQEFKQYAELMRSILRELTRHSQQVNYTPILIQGISEALRQPEFSQLQQVQMLIQLLEQEQEQLFPLIFALPDFDTDSKRVTVRIGMENPLEPLNICTLISANYCKGNIPVGSVGLLGPTRMLYENAIALVEATADYLSEALS